MERKKPPETGAFFIETLDVSLQEFRVGSLLLH